MTDNTMDYQCLFENIQTAHFHRALRIIQIINSLCIIAVALSITTFDSCDKSQVEANACKITKITNLIEIESEILLSRSRLETDKH